jgi:CopG family nickel-responsive transcriptional regulator
MSTITASSGSLAGSPIITTITTISPWHENCLEAVLLRGPAGEVRHFAESTMAERGVRHGNLHMIPVAVDTPHRHPGHGATHRHTHPMT